MPSLERPSTTHPVLRALTLLTSTCVSLACYQPDQSARLPDESSRIPAELHDWSLSDAGADAALPLSDITLSFHVMTAPVGGRFAPNNVGAIWIERDDGTFVKTLALWGRTRAQYLRRFQAAARGNTVDAVTSATLPQHTDHDVSWDFRDLSGTPVEDANHRLLIELTDKNSTGASLELPFANDGEPAHFTPPDTAQFRDLTLTIERADR